MSLASLLAAIAAIGTTTTGLVYLIKRFFPPTTPEQTKEKTDSEEASRQAAEQSSGRPSE